MAPTLRMLSAPKVLVINDDPRQLDELISGLRIEGCPAVGAVNFQQAVEALANDDCDAAIIDLMISEMNGLKLARKFKQMYPELLTMLMSDYLLSPVQLAKADTGVVGFVPKPCCVQSLARFIRRKLGSKSLREEETTNSSSDGNDSLSPFEVHSFQYAL